MFLLDKILFTLFVTNTLIDGFPISTHVDLRKVGTIKLKSGDIYNVLKPVTHRIEDHFPDVLLRRDTKHNPTEKVFVDNNGLRHFWSELSDKNSHYRKAGKDFYLENKNEVTKIIKTKTSENDTEVKLNGTLAEDINYTEVAINEVKTIVVNNETTTPPVLTKSRKKKKIKKKQHIPAALRKPALREPKQRTVVHTTFFCPFFGVIKMSRYID